MSNQVLEVDARIVQCRCEETPFGLAVRCALERDHVGYHEAVVRFGPEAGVTVAYSYRWLDPAQEADIASRRSGRR